MVRVLFPRQLKACMLPPGCCRAVQWLLVLACESVSHVLVKVAEPPRTPPPRFSGQYHAHRRVSLDNSLLSALWGEVCPAAHSQTQHKINLIHNNNVILESVFVICACSAKLGCCLKAAAAACCQNTLCRRKTAGAYTQPFPGPYPAGGALWPAKPASSSRRLPPGVCLVREILGTHTTVKMTKANFIILINMHKPTAL